MVDTVERVRSEVAEVHEITRNLHSEVIRFRSSEPCGVAMEENAEEGARIFRVDRVEEVPPEIPTLCRDAIEGLGAALDLLPQPLDERVVGSAPSATLRVIRKLRHIARDRAPRTVVANAPPRLALFGSHVMEAIPATGPATPLSDVPPGTEVRCPLREGDLLKTQPLHQPPPDSVEILVTVAFDEPDVIECKPVVLTLSRMAQVVDRLARGAAPPS